MDDSCGLVLLTVAEHERFLDSLGFSRVFIYMYIFLSFLYFYILIRLVHEGNVKKNIFFCS